MLTAIVYNSATGSCERYAKELSRALHLPCMPLKGQHVRSDGKVIYIGWLMAGRVTGYAQAVKKLDVAAVVAVGMGPVSKAQITQGRELNGVPAQVPYFLLQGGFHLNRLHFPLRLIMRLKAREIVVRLRHKAEKTALNAQELATLNMALRGDGEPAAWDCSAVIDWARKENGFLTRSNELAR